MFGIGVRRVTMEETLALLLQWMQEERPCRYAVTPNVGHVVHLQKDRHQNQIAGCHTAHVHIRPLLANPVARSIPNPGRRSQQEGHTAGKLFSRGQHITDSLLRTCSGGNPARAAIRRTLPHLPDSLLSNLRVKLEIRPDLLLGWSLPFALPFVL